VEFLQKEAGASVASKLIDIVNMEVPVKKVPVDYAKINLVAGIDIPKETVDKILENLGFVFEGASVIVPSWRYDDIAIAEDLAEEVIRLYGYDKLPNQLLTGEIPSKSADTIFKTEDMARAYLKHQGWFECYTNSSTSKILAGDNAVKVANPLSEDFSYLKTSLLPQLEAVLEKNQGYAEKIKVFELASVYLAQKNDLPDQPMRLGLASRGVAYLELKGEIEGLVDELGGAKLDFAIQEIGNGILAAELDFESLAKQANKNKTYAPLSSFNSIKEDLTLVISDDRDIRYPEIIELISAVDKRVKKLEFKDIYKNFLTLAIEYHDSAKQISSEQTQEIRGKIFKELENKLEVRLKV
jgi:phenylalanyl-tRNA synthetase beta chain